MADLRAENTKNDTVEVNKITKRSESYEHK